TELWPQTSYMVWANNSGGSSVAYLNITVVDELPTLSYTPNTLVLTKGNQSSDLPLNATLTGPGEITSWAINATLPVGLNFGTNNGTIWGVPQVNMTTTEYTVWANNSGGSVSTTINITVLEPIVVLDYNPENLTLVRSIAMTDLHPIVTGGSVETWEIHPSIPAGLNFADGVLSGTPTVNMTLTMFTIYANTTGGSASHTINLTILEPGVILEYNPENQTMTRGVAMVTMTPTVTNGTAETWSIDPLLPSGLNFNNGVISGTPTVNMTRTMFTVWANTTGGAAFHTINLTILEPIVGLDYNPENLTLTRGVAMADLHPIITGGNVSEWGISPIPLSGLTFAEGLLYGTPGINQTTPIMYTIYANTTGGSITHTINITVLEPVVDLFYNPENQTFIRTEQAIAWSPTVSGGIPETWAIEPALPNGLVFDNGTISGSPTVNLTTTQYT
ncbi:MAG: putative Ig domain-containing protein, partial [Poseidonia sp.]